MDFINAIIETVVVLLLGLGLAAGVLLGCLVLVSFGIDILVNRKLRQRAKYGLPDGYD